MEMLGCQAPDLFQKQVIENVELNLNGQWSFVPLYYRVFGPPSIDQEPDHVQGFQGVVFVTRATIYSKRVGTQLQADHARLAEGIRHIKPYSNVPLALIVQSDHKEVDEKEVLAAFKLDKDYYNGRISTVSIFVLTGDTDQRELGEEVVEHLAQASPEYPLLERVVLHDFMWKSWQNSRSPLVDTRGLAKIWNSVVKDTRKGLMQDGVDPNYSWPPAGFTDNLKDSMLSDNNKEEFSQIASLLQDYLLPEALSNEGELEYMKRLRKRDESALALDCLSPRSTFNSELQYNVVEKSVRQCLLELALEKKLTEPKFSFWNPTLKNNSKSKQIKPPSKPKKVALSANLSKKFELLRKKLEQRKNIWKNTSDELSKRREAMFEVSGNHAFVF